MPKGLSAPRTATCRCCGGEFVTRLVGRAGWYCRRPECMERRWRAADKRTKARRAQERQRQVNVKALVPDGTDRILLGRVAGAVIRASVLIEPADRKLAAAVTAYRTRPSSGTARLVAAAALAIATDLADTEQGAGAERP